MDSTASAAPAMFTSIFKRERKEKSGVGKQACCFLAVTKQNATQSSSSAKNPPIAGTEHEEHDNANEKINKERGLPIIPPAIAATLVVFPVGVVCAGK